MRVGLALPHYDTSHAGRPASWEGVKEVALLAERTGFDSVWVSDHFFLDWGKYGGPGSVQGSLECWTTMAALAAATTRVRIGSLTACNDFRHPGLLAKMAASLDRLSEGRVEVGLGAGWYEPEYGAVGLDFDRPAVRIARLGEAVEIVQRLLQGEELFFKGDHYDIRGAICRPGPVQEPRPSVWIGGKGDLLLRTVARVADGWNFSWLGSMDGYRARVAALERAATLVGRTTPLRRSVGAYVIAGTDDRDARRRFERLVERTPDGVLRRMNGGAAVSWEEFRERNFAGSVAEVVDRIGALAELDVEEMIVSLGALPFQVGDNEDVELIGSEVAPAVAEIGGRG